MAGKHAIRKESSIEINGHPIGIGLSVGYVDGPPIFGECEWDGCDKPSTEETLLGLHFCTNHFSDFYTES